MTVLFCLFCFLFSTYILIFLSSSAMEFAIKYVLSYMCENVKNFNKNVSEKKEKVILRHQGCPWITQHTSCYFLFGIWRKAGLLPASSVIVRQLLK